MNTKTQQLRQLLAASEMLTITGCHDALSAHLAEQAGFPAVFMSGFAVSASRLAIPDTGLISFGEMLDQGRNIANAIGIPLFGDGDTGFGNAMNIKRTVREYAQAGFACIMLEDQLSPNRNSLGKIAVYPQALVNRKDSVMIQNCVTRRTLSLPAFAMIDNDSPVDTTYHQSKHTNSD